MNIRIDASKPSGTISPLWFGHNLEHTRSCVWRGMSAQIVRNRKFAGKPKRTGEAAEWYRVGPRETFFLVDPDDPFTAHYNPKDVRRWKEMNGQRIENCIPGAEAGIGQDDVPLFAGRAYDGRVTLKSGVPIALKIRLLSDSCQTTHFETTIDVAAGDWREVTFSFEMRVDDPRARMEITFDRAGVVTLGAVSLLPADHFHGMRRDVVALLKELGVPLLRWPGGNFAGDYRWQDGLLPVEKRSPLCAFTEIETLPHTHGFDMHEIGIDEYAALCREIGARPYLTINLAWEPPETAAAWVEYCNGGADTNWGRIRVERGHAEPYNVRLWSLGNELGYGHMEGPNTPAAYAEKAAACAKAMKAVDPSLEFVSSGKWDVDEWYPQCLKPLASAVDHFAHHFYTPQMRAYGGDAGQAEFRRVTSTPDAVFDEVRSIRRRADAATGDRRAGIAFDEWNVWYAWYRMIDIVDGIHAALMLHRFIRESRDLGITIGSYFEPVNEGAIDVQPDAARLTAVGKVFRLFKVHQGKTLIPLTIDDPDVDAAASLDENTSEALLTVVNRHPCESREVRIEAVGMKPVGGILLSAENFLPGSDFTETELSVAAGKLRLPKHSVAGIRLK